MRWETNVVLDGEIVAFDDDGTPSFFLLGQRPANFVVFDLLFRDGDRCGLPFEARRALLDQLALPKPAVLSQPVLGRRRGPVRGSRGPGHGRHRRQAGGLPLLPGPAFARLAQDRPQAPREAVVGGFLAGEGARTATFGSLLLGLWADDGLRFVGSVGSGFTEQP